MTTSRCPHEPDLLDALAAGHWPDACEAELRDHVSACVECREISIVAEAFIADRRETEQRADLPTSGATWWRMQLRMEREAKEAAAKTVGRAQGAVIAVTLAAITVVLVSTSLVRMGWQWLTSAMPHVADFAGLSSAVPLTVLVLAGVAILVFAPIAVYLAIARD